MVSFDHQHIRCPDAFPHVYWGMAQIGEPSQTAARREQIIFSVRDQKSHRLLCIVRHGKAANLQIAKLKGAPGFEKLPGHPMLEPFLGFGRRAAIRKNLNLRIAGQPFQPSGMITMLVG